MGEELRWRLELLYSLADRLRRELEEQDRKAPYLYPPQVAGAGAGDRKG